MEEIFKYLPESSLEYPTAAGLARMSLGLTEERVLPSTIAAWDVNPHAFEFNGTIDTRLVFTGSKSFTLGDGSTLQDTDVTILQF